MATEVDGGYVVITVGQFASVCAARKDGIISFLALRVWLAAHEQKAKRCLAKGRLSFTSFPRVHFRHGNIAASLKLALVARRVTSYSHFRDGNIAASLKRPD